MYELWNHTSAGINTGNCIFMVLISDIHEVL